MVSFPEIPERPDDITPEWLTGALQSRGWLADGKVSEIDREILGADAGFLGVIARLRLRFDGDPSGAPDRLIAKLPTAADANRLMGEILGAYWREIHFYRELSGAFPIRVPQFYYGDLTPDPLREKQDDIVVRLDRLPGWLVGPLMLAGSLLVKRNAHRYVLLIEDLAPAEVGDQAAGASPETCARVLDAAATLHAKYWQHPMLGEHFWISRQASGPRTRHRMYTRVRKAFRARHAALLEGKRLTVVDWLDRNGMALSEAVHRDPPQTLLHCDLRFDNVFLGDDEVILADWQLTGVGAAAYDVAYFLSGALSSDTPPETERELLRGYHASLVERGVTDYPFETFLRDYQRALLSVLHIVGSTDSVDLGEARGLDMMDHWTERLLNLLTRVPLDEIL